MRVNPISGLESVSANLLLNPIRRIIETYTKFNALDKTKFCKKVDGAKKLFDVNLTQSMMLRQN